MKNHPMNRMTRAATVFAGLFLCCIAPDVSAEELKPISQLTFDALDDSGELTEESAKSLGAVFMFTKTKTAIEKLKRIKPGMVKNALACGMVPGQFGNYVSLKNPPVLSGKFTICFWFRSETGQWLTCLVYYKDGWSSERGFAVRTYDDKIGVYRNAPGGGVNGEAVALAPRIQVGTWYFAAVVWDGVAWKLCLNGKMIEEIEGAEELPFLSPRAGTPMNIGGYANNSNNVFQGAIDEFRIYKGALTAEQITEIMSKDVEIARKQKGNTNSNSKSN